MGRCELSAVCQGEMASGPDYTFCNGDVHTIVDNILMDVEAASMTSCFTHFMEDLNTSDHLPLTVAMIYNACLDTYSKSNSFKKIDWVKAELR